MHKHHLYIYFYKTNLDLALIEFFLRGPGGRAENFRAARENFQNHRLFHREAWGNHKKLSNTDFLPHPGIFFIRARIEYLS